MVSAADNGMGRIELNAQSGKVIVNNIPFVGLIGICIPVAVIGAYLYVVPSVIHKGFAHAPDYADLMHIPSPALLFAQLFLCKAGNGVRCVGNGGEQGAEVGSTHVVYGLFKLDGVKLAVSGASAAAYALLRQRAENIRYVD